MKKIFSLTIALLLFLTFNVNIFAESSEIPQDVLAAANDGINLVKTKIGSNPGQWGFSDVDEVNRLSLGEGFHVNYISGDKLSKASGDSLAELIDPDIIDTWEFTLDLDGSPKVFLTVANDNGIYQVVHFGGNAGSFGIAKSNFRRLTSDKGITSKPSLMRAGKTYYFVTELDSKEFVLPVKPENDTSIKDNDQLKSASEIIDQLKISNNTTERTGRGGSASGMASTTSESRSSNSIIIIISIALVLTLLAAVAAFAHRHISVKG